MSGRTAIWIDFENAPHVWVLSPIVKRLRRKGFELILTARDFSCTVGLCHHLGYGNVNVVGAPGYSRNGASRVWRILGRAASLYRQLYPLRKKIALSLSHGSRSQLLAARGLQIPTLMMDDYEFSSQGFCRFADCILVPFPIPGSAWARHSPKVLHYPGLKEELYLADFVASRNIPKEIREQSKKVLVLFRQEAPFAHYRSEQGGILQRSILEYLRQADNILLVLLPRDQTQREELPTFCRNHSIDYFIPDGIVDGPSLISQMDLVIGGGGTMTREAAVLGVPSYSFFSGPWGAVDRYLLEQGRLVRITKPEDVERILLRKRTTSLSKVNKGVLKFITSFVEECADEAKKI